MQEFSFEAIQSYVFFLIGISLVLISLFRKPAQDELKNTGDQAEGTIVEVGSSNDACGGSTRISMKDKVKIRFVTKDKTWIAADMQQDFAIYFTNQYKLGDKVTVYYDTKNPENFMVDTKQSSEKGKMLFLFVGILFTCAGLYMIIV